MKTVKTAIIILVLLASGISASSAENVIMTNVSLNGVNAVINDIEVFQGNSPARTSDIPIGYHLELLDNAGNSLYSVYYEYNFYYSVSEEENSTPAILDSSEVSESIIIPYIKDAFAIRVTSPSGEQDIKMLPEDKIGLPVSSKRFKSVSSGVLHIVVLPSLFTTASEMDYFRSFVQDAIDLFFLFRPINEYTRSQIQFHVVQESQDLTGDMSKVMAAAAKSGFLYDEIVVIEKSNTRGGVASLQMSDYV